MTALQFMCPIHAASVQAHLASLSLCKKIIKEIFLDNQLALLCHIFIDECGFVTAAFAFSVALWLSMDSVSLIGCMLVMFQIGGQVVFEPAVCCWGLASISQSQYPA